MQVRIVPAIVLATPERTPGFTQGSREEARVDLLVFLSQLDGPGGTVIGAESSAEYSFRTTAAYNHRHALGTWHHADEEHN